MKTESLYRQIRELIAAKEFEALRKLEIEKPQQFNWVEEVFENIHVKEAPDAQALIWTDSSLTKIFSYRDLSMYCNRYLNFLHGHGLQEQDVIFSQMPLLPGRQKGQNFIPFLHKIFIHRTGSISLRFMNTGT